MESKTSSRTQVQTLLTGLAMGESPRWHENRLWFSDWGAQEIIAVDHRGRSEVALRTSFGLPFALVGTDGLVRQVADGIAFPNGMAVTPDTSTLIIAESHGKRLTAFDIGTDGSLATRRVWADLGDGVPDGICLDADNAIWYGDVPNKRCVRVREGGHVLQTINLDCGCFACMLGGASKSTLFLIATEWRGMEKITEVAQARTGQVLVTDASAPGVGWP
jgi:sugar lactone lactonase YvrE